MITIFTPTYNNRDSLWTLFHSLEAQTCKDFEWVIVDDGSKDGTMGLIERFETIVHQFPLRYYYRRHGGRHRAVNQGIKEAKGELFFIVDANDHLPCHAIEVVKKHYDRIKDNPEFGVIAGSKCDLSGIRLSGYYAEIFKTDVLREFQYPEIEGEYFCPKNLISTTIGRKYKKHCFEEYIYTLHSITDNSETEEMYRNSPIATVTYYSQLFRASKKLKNKFESAVGFWRYMPIRMIKNATKYGMVTPLSLMCFIPGMIKNNYKWK